MVASSMTSAAASSSTIVCTSGRLLRGGVVAEIRCANAHAYQGLVAARANRQRSAQAFWSTAQRAGAHSSRNGRILILVWLQDNRKANNVRCDVYTDDLGWRPLFGWPGAPVSMRAITPSAQPATLPPAPRAAPKAALRPRRGAVARRPQKRPWAEVESTFFPVGHRLHALCPRAKVARLTDVFAQLTKDKCHIGEKLSSWFGGGRLGYLDGARLREGPLERQRRQEDVGGDAADVREGVVHAVSAAMTSHMSIVIRVSHCRLEK